MPVEMATARLLVDVRTWERACEQTAEAHAAILRSLHRLEEALLAPGSSPHEWSDQVQRELLVLIDRLENHYKAVASPAGLIGFIEQLQGHSRAVSEINKAHDMLLDDGQSLLRVLSS